MVKVAESTVDRWIFMTAIEIYPYEVHMIEIMLKNQKYMFNKTANA